MRLVTRRAPAHPHTHGRPATPHRLLLAGRRTDRECHRFRRAGRCRTFRRRIARRFPRTTDTLGRPLRDLRLSVIDQCNFRCGYCMPRESFGADYAFMPSSERLSFAQLEKIARAFTSLGVEKIRITGGEPLLRRNLEALIERLAALTTVDGKPVEIALTTNGSLLAAKARTLRDAGLSRVTVSLDALDDAVFRRMSDTDVPVSRVLAGIEAAQAASSRRSRSTR